MVQTDTETIWQELSQALRTFIKRRVSNTDDVEDILQEIFIKIHQKLDDLEDETRLQGWVYQIGRNAIHDYYRRQNILVELPETLPTDPTPDVSLNKELAACLRPMAERLPDKYREAIALTEFEGLTQKEMGKRLGLSVSGAKSRVQRGRHELKAILLACCDVEFDRVGNILDYQQTQSECEPDCCQ
ncbi:MAG: RNA polymerase sigma factor SigZ [Chloroflexota bacterium]